MMPIKYYMQTPYKKYINFILPSAISVIGLGIWGILFAWMLEAGLFNPEVTGNLPLAKDSSLCFLLSGTSLLLLCLYRDRQRIIVFARILAAITILCAVLSAFQNLFPSVYTAVLPFIKNNFYLGMSLQTGFCFACTAIALFYMPNERNGKIVQVLLHIVSFISFVVITGHVLRVPNLYTFTFFSAMAIYAALGFLVLSAAASFMNPNDGITGMLTGKMIGNIMARRLLLRISAAIFITSSLLIIFHRKSWVNVEFGIAMLAITFTVATLFFIYKTSHVLNRIEHRKEIAKDNFKAAIESAPNALVMADIQGNIAMVNRQANIIFGYEEGELAGQKLDVLVPQRFRNAHQEKQPVYFKNPKPRHFSEVLDLYALRKDGSEFPIEIGITPIKTENGTVALASIIDMTERRKNEAIIKKQMSELQMKNQEMEHFTYIASHDLQEPLRTLSNYIQLFEEDYPHMMTEEVRIHFSEMDAAVNRMSTLVRSLLDYGRLGKNSSVVLADTNKILQDVMADLKTLITNTNTTITVKETLPTLYLYETEFRQLLQNLINNAIKFRKKDTPPEITIGFRQEGESCQFYVSDNGIGIDRRFSERIFLMFQRLNKEEDFAGHGVGLANCKKIADMHGGTIWVESEVGQGSTFNFTTALIKP
jgi:PAS domain S-box-containing protein